MTAFGYPPQGAASIDHTYSALFGVGMSIRIRNGMERQAVSRQVKLREREVEQLALAFAGTQGPRVLPGTYTVVVVDSTLPSGVTATFDLDIRTMAGARAAVAFIGGIRTV